MIMEVEDLDPKRESQLPLRTSRSTVDNEDLVLERLVKSIGEECGKETSEYLAKSRASDFGE